MTDESEPLMMFDAARKQVFHMAHTIITKFDLIPLDEHNVREPEYFAMYAYLLAVAEAVSSYDKWLASLPTPITLNVDSEPIENPPTAYDRYMSMASRMWKLVPLLEQYMKEQEG